jgi:hypothetical protein
MLTAPLLRIPQRLLPKGLGFRVLTALFPKEGVDMLIAHGVLFIRCSYLDTVAQAFCLVALIAYLLPRQLGISVPAFGAETIDKLVVDPSSGYREAVK